MYPISFLISMPFAMIRVPALERRFPIILFVDVSPLIEQTRERDKKAYFVGKKGRDM